MKKNKKKKLNPRQWALHRFYSENTHRYVHDQEVCETLYEWYPFDLNTTNFKDTSARRVLTDDKNVLRESGRIPTLLISNTGKGSKYATQEEWDLYNERKEAKLRKEWATHRIMKRKASRHRQQKLKEEKSKAREYVRAFVETNNEVVV